MILNAKTLIGRPVPIRALRPGGWPELAASPRLAVAARQAKFAGKAGQLLLLQGADGAVEQALFGLGEDEQEGAMLFRGLAARLPVGDYELESGAPGLDPDLVALAWTLGAYRFDRFKGEGGAVPGRLTVADAQWDRVAVVAEACALARDLINAPANHMGPDQVEVAARSVAAANGADIAVVRGLDLLTQNYPAIHAVGRAADPARAPRMIEISWGQGPLLAIVGKGVTFDTGGLDLKPSAGMRWMKKDMGGAAHALALGQMIMRRALPVRLVILLPVVENAVAGDAMRPGDVLASRKGLTIEVGNTDAEGRLILADALARAAELDPVLTVDLATLTGAARVALGPDIVPYYTDDDALAGEIDAAARRVRDPVWRMPLWSGYAGAIDSDIADLKNDADPWSQAGSMTAALFLKRFAPARSWVHFDIFAWNARARPGWPQGAEAQAIRALFALIEARYR